MDHDGTTPPLYSLTRGSGPLVAVAVHDGHAARPEVAALFALDEAARLREEDPFTGGWTQVASTRMVVNRSRFELDLNRPRERAVYRTPEDAWGLNVWNAPPPNAVLGRSLAEYDDFYRELRRVLLHLVAQHGRVVVLDIHSYNHRRRGPDAPPDDPERNPDINVGTGTLDRDRWGAVVERFIEEMSAYDFQGGKLDVRENVRFFGGQIPRWIHQEFPEHACALAIEVKKIFMDEWTGQPDAVRVAAVQQALAAGARGALEVLARMK